MFVYPMLRQTMTISFMSVTFASNFSPLAYADVGFVSIRTGSDNISWVYWSQSQKTVNIPNTGGYLRHTYNRPTHDAVKPHWGLFLPMFFNDWATSMPSLVIQPSTATMSDTKEGKRHFTITSFLNCNCNFDMFSAQDLKFLLTSKNKVWLVSIIRFDL